MKKALLVVGGVIAATVIDLTHMIWSRSNSGQGFNKASWNAGALGHGKYNIMKLVKGK